MRKVSINWSKKGNIVTKYRNNNYQLFFDLKVIEPEIKREIVALQAQIEDAKKALMRAVEMQAMCDHAYDINHPNDAIEKIATKLFMQEVKQWHKSS